MNPWRVVANILEHIRSQTHKLQLFREKLQINWIPSQLKCLFRTGESL